MRSCEWVVYAKPPFGGAPQALAYLGRYTHRVALSNDRLLAAGEDEVTFQWKDYRHKHKHKSRRMTLAADEFIRRFLIHVLPPGFQRIRHFGFLANRFRKQKLALCRNLLAAAITELLPSPPQCQLLLAAMAAPRHPGCPNCGAGILLRSALLPAYRWPSVPADSS